MSIKVRIPQPLQKTTKGLDLVSADGADVKALIDNLDKDYPGIKDRLCDESGKIRRFINIYVNEEDIRFLQGDKTALAGGGRSFNYPGDRGRMQPSPSHSLSHRERENRKVLL